MKTLPIAIIACGLVAAYISYPTQHGTRTRIASPSIAAQLPKDNTRPMGVYVTDSAGVMQPMKIQRLQTSVKITGTLAVTTVDMTVYNPHGRVLEGEFETPVMEGQTVCRFALDINGKLREGVVIEKEKARAAFESVVRQKIDPALLEWTRGNTFKTRIYPIPARGSRRIVVAFEQEMMSSSEGYAYTLPFAFQEVIDTFDFTVDVAAFGERPSLAGNALEGVSFTPRGRSYFAEIHKTNVVVDKPFRCAIPVTSGNTLITVNAFGNERYFAAFVPVPSVTTERPAPRTITLLWDASLSSRGRDLDKELDLLDAYFKQIRNVRVSLVPFSIETHSRSEYQVAAGDWSMLRAALLSMPSDGATQLGTLPLTTITTDLTLLVSDGVSTFGQHVPPRASRPVLAITSAAQSDHDVLRSIAEQSGGSFVNLVERSTDDAFAMMTTQRLTLMSIDVISGLVTSTYPTGVINAGMLTVGGIMESKEAELELKFGHGGRVSETRSLTINILEHLDTGTAVARLWAGSQLRQLGMDRNRNESAIVALGKKFTIVTPGTSLLVLDRIEDYVQHRIEPPVSEPEMRTQYFASVSKIVEDSARISQERLNNVARMLTDRSKWYDRKVEVKNARKKDGTYGNASAGAIGYGGSAAVESTGRTYADVPVTTIQPPPTTESIASAVSQTSASRETVVGAVRLSSIARSNVKASAVPTGWSGSDADGSISNTGSPLSTAMPSPLAARASDDQVQSAESEDLDERVEAMVTTNDALSVTDLFKHNDAVQRPAYIEELHKTHPTNLYARYLSIRDSVATNPGFYIDVSDIMRDKGLKSEALRVLSNMAEMASEDPRLLRVLGQRLMQLDESEYAVLVFDDVKRMRGEEPQSYRDLGLACAQAKQYQRAVDNLYQVVTRTWDSRFPEIELIAVNELNRVLHDAGTAVNQQHIDRRLLKSMPVDMRVVLSWDADDCDMDLWVIDPRGEKCFYSNRDTELGGHLSRDLTGGYGPEEFLLKKAPKGDYEFKVHYYGDRQQRLTGPTTITVDVFTHYGTPKESKKSMTVRVDGVSRVVDIGKIAFN